MTDTAAVFPPESYRRLRRLMDSGQGYLAPGPCAIPSCDRARPDPRPLNSTYVWDHCHQHDYVRGMLCRYHNVQLGPIENQDHWALRIKPPSRDLLVYWARCPDCAADGPWRPLMLRQSPTRIALAAWFAGQVVAGGFRRIAEREADQAAASVIRIAERDAARAARIADWAAVAAVLRPAFAAERARREARSAAALRGMATRRAREAARTGAQL